jgi:hypothetical protein
VLIYNQLIKFLRRVLDNLMVIRLVKKFPTFYGRIFGPKRDEITGEWRKLHNE